MKSLLFLAAGVAAVSLAPSAQALTTEAVVDKIRYCRNSTILCNSKLQSDYHWWDHYGVAEAKQKQTYISRYNDPDKANVEHLVFISAGQRAEAWLDIGDDWASPSILLTGQPSGFADQWPNDDAQRTFNLPTNSMPYRLFAENVYEEANTFAGLAFDARFNQKFSEGNKEEIVNAYYSWLKSKVYSHKLKSVYLAGHSRGGSLVMRLAKKFQDEFPNVALIVHTFDGVANKEDGELGTYGSKMDNPVTSDSDYWAWKTDLRLEFSSKKNLSVMNFISGHKFLGLWVRAFSHQSANENITDLGWYYQTWSTHDHVGIADSPFLISQALNHVRERVRAFTTNMAPQATASASSTYCASPGSLHCYSPSKINDRDLDSRVGGFYSWTNSSTSLPQWVQLKWPGTIKTSRLEVVTSEDYPIQNYRIEYLSNGSWKTLVQETGNDQLHIRHAFFPVVTNAIRLVGLQGPSNQPQYVRVNEILVPGEWVDPPNQAPVARCSASPSYGTGSVYSNLKGTSSYDSDGSIVSYKWRFSDGGSASGSNIYRTFYGAPDRTVYHTATLTVTDNEGASSSKSCSITVAPAGDCDQPILQQQDSEEGALEATRMPICPLTR